jgi:YD repeat-containing protein
MGTGSNAYVYDVNDNRTQVIKSNGATGSDRRYCYDAQDRLQYRNTGAACSSTANDESYVYDAAGNRTESIVGASTTNFAYDLTGQLCQVGATTCGTHNVAYDAAGHTRSWNGWFFTYDAEGRLTTACKDSNCATHKERVEFTYDGEGRRTQQNTAPANGTFTNYEFRYQGDSVVEERLNGTVTRHYLVDVTGAITKLVVPAGQANAGGAGDTARG